MKPRALALFFVIAVAAPCFGGGDPEFHAVVKTIEAEYGARHIRIPFLGVATFCLKIAQVPGTSGLKIAVFDHLSRANRTSNDAIQQSIEASIGSTWRPLVRVRSDSEVTLIYAHPSDKEVHALIVCLQPDTATIVQAKVSAAQIRKWIEAPSEVTHELD